MTEDDIQKTLQEYGTAISQGDAAKAAACWAIPGLVLSDKGAIAITERAQVDRFFTQAIAAYRQRGIVTTRPELIQVDRLSEGVSLVKVRWPYFDAEGKRRGEETSIYLMRAHDDGRPRVTVALETAAR